MRLQCCDLSSGLIILTFNNKEHSLERDDQSGQGSKFRVTAADKPSLQKDLTTDMRRS